MAVLRGDGPPSRREDRNRRGAAASIRAAIFDLDGLLIDSEPLWRNAEREVFAGIGLDLTDDDCRSTMGMRCDAVVALWFERRPWKGPSPAEVQSRIENRMLELVRSEGAAMPGVHHALAVVKALGCRMAVASSSGPALIDAALKRLGILDQFPIRCSAFNEAHGKPHPAVFLRAARNLGVNPTECIVFEDSVIGAVAARRAGMRVIAVPDEKHRKDPGFDDADTVLRTLAEVRPEVLLR